MGPSLAEKTTGWTLRSMSGAVLPELKRLGFKWTTVSTGIKELFIADRIEEGNGKKHLIHFRLLKMGREYGVSFHIDKVGSESNSSARYFHLGLAETTWKFFEEGELVYMQFEDTTEETKTVLTLCIGRTK